MNFLIESEQREEALVQTARNLAAMLADPSTKEVLSTFNIKSYAENVASDYGPDFTTHYTLVIPDVRSDLAAMLITDAEIVYLSSVKRDNAPLTRLNEEEIANLYEAITNERPLEFQRRHSRYDPSAPCKVKVGGVTFETARNIHSTSADEILERMKVAENKVVALNEKQRPKFTGGNRFEEAAARIKQEQVMGTTAKLGGLDE